jgi:hypothetical protein
MRSPHELKADPQFDFMVGKLVGATEMLTHYMALHGDERAADMATRAHSVLDYFLEDDRQHQLERGGESWEGESKSPTSTT